jgi:hypothetical protein
MGVFAQFSQVVLLHQKRLRHKYDKHQYFLDGFLMQEIVECQPVRI